MSLRPRDDRNGQYEGYLRINGKTYRKFLGTDNREQGERLLFEWKNSLITDASSEASEENMSFSFFAERLIEKQMDYPPPPSGLEVYQDTRRLLNRKRGLIEFFGERDIRSVTKAEIEKFIRQLPLDGRKLTTNTLRKHLNVLRQVVGMSEHKVEIPKVKGLTTQPRGYFNAEEYRTIRDKSKELEGFQYQDYNGSVYTIDLDLHDFIVFMVGSSLRPTIGEVFSLQHKDIKRKTLKKTPYLEFPLVRKNRRMLVQTLATSSYAYRDLCKRHTGYGDEDYLFLPSLSNRRTAMRRMGLHFSHLLKEIGIKYGSLGELRSPYSLRHTSLLFNLSQPNVDLLDICRRSDTSMKMIQDFYYPIVAQEEKLESFLRAAKRTSL